MEKHQVTRWDNNDFGLIVQDNNLIRASYMMPLNTKRLFLLAVSKINSMNYPAKGTCIGVTVSAEQWSSLYGNDQAWRSLKTATEDLMKRQLTEYPNSKKHKRVINFCDSAQYANDEALCTIKFSYSISLMLAGMVDEFTKMDLLSVAKFSSRNSVRIYELISQMRNSNQDNWWLKISVDEFRTIMGFSETQYSRFAELKRTVIEASIKEINEKSDLFVTVDYIRKGRKIVGLHFQFKENDQLSLDW